MAKTKPGLTLGYWKKFLEGATEKSSCYVSDVYQSKRKAHIAVVLTHRKTGESRKLFCSLTPSDFRTDANIIREAKRICRELSGQC